MEPLQTLVGQMGGVEGSTSHTGSHGAELAQRQTPGVSLVCREREVVMAS